MRILFLLSLLASSIINRIDAQKLSFDLDDTAREKIHKWIDTNLYKGKTILNDTNSNIYLLDSTWQLTDRNSLVYIRLVSREKNEKGLYRYEDYYRNKNVRNIGFIKDYFDYTDVSNIKNHYGDKAEFREDGTIRNYAATTDRGVPYKIFHYDRGGKLISDKEYTQQNHGLFWDNRSDEYSVGWHRIFSRMLYDYLINIDDGILENDKIYDMIIHLGVSETGQLIQVACVSPHKYLNKLIQGEINNQKKYFHSSVYDGQSITEYVKFPIVFRNE